MIWLLFIVASLGTNFSFQWNRLISAERDSNWRWKKHACHFWRLCCFVLQSLVPKSPFMKMVSSRSSIQALHHLMTEYGFMKSRVSCSLTGSSHLPYGPCLVRETGPPLLWDFVDPCNWGPADPLPGLAWCGYSTAHERRYCVSSKNDWVVLGLEKKSGKRSLSCGCW